MDVFIAIARAICISIGAVVILVVMYSFISIIKDLCIKSYNKNKKKSYIIKYALTYPIVRCEYNAKKFKYEFDELAIEQIIVRGKNIKDAIRRMKYDIVVNCSLIIISIIETETI